MYRICLETLSCLSEVLLTPPNPSPFISAALQSDAVLAPGCRPHHPEHAILGISLHLVFPWSPLRPGQPTHMLESNSGPVPAAKLSWTWIQTLLPLP